MPSLRNPAFVLCFLSLSLAACAPPSSSDLPNRTPVRRTKSITVPEQLGGDALTTEAALETPPMTRHATGRPASRRPLPTRARTAPSSSLPPRVDLSKMAPPVGDQGDSQACVAWAIGHGLMGWWSRRANVPGVPFAPMFLYGRAVQGDCQASADPELVFRTLQEEGVMSFRSYEPMESNLDCQSHDLSSAVANEARRHRITSYTMLPLENPQDEIMSELAAGRPVVIGIAVFNSLANADAAHTFIEAPTDENEEPSGGHALAAFAYDEQGLWVLNTWGAPWGKNGWGELSWDYVLGGSKGQGPNYANLDLVASITGLVPN